MTIYGLLLSHFDGARCRMPLVPGPPFSRVELAMFVRVLTGSLVVLMLVRCSLLPPVLNATESAPTLGWQAQESATMKATPVPPVSETEAPAPAAAPAALAPNAQK